MKERPILFKEAHAFATCDKDAPGAFYGPDRRITSDYGDWFQVHYAADRGDITWEPPVFRSPIFLPRWAARIVLEVVNVRIERLQDIQHNEADAIAEGLTVVIDRPGEDWDRTYGVDGKQTNRTAWAAFVRLWNDLYPEADGILQRPAHEKAWSRNPWVWVVEFRRLEPSEVG